MTGWRAIALPPATRAAVLTPIQPIKRVRAITNPLTNTVGAAGTPLLNNDPTRTRWRVYNFGTATVYVGINFLPTATVAFPIDPNGGWLEFSRDEDGDIAILPVVASAASYPQTVFVFTEVSEG